ncbi:Metallo-hydrolase/oxidoreductase [Ramaria rubella]|nr:Metallo-hydrolase/oxidoreductase [Ramaria rubella]
MPPVSLSFPVSVSAPNSKGNDLGSPRPAHHQNNSGTLFTNPWPSFRDLSHASQALANFTRPPIPPNISALVRVQKPDWGASAPEKLKATWMGHACFLVELPTPQGASRGPRILFDPVFSRRCSLFSWIGPVRYTEPPCTLKELPEVDIVVYSHNHYDHLDTTTLGTLISKARSSDASPPRTHIFAPLNNDYLFRALSIPPSNVHCLDWWQHNTVSVDLPPLSKYDSSPSFDIEQTPQTPLDTDGIVTAPITTSFRITCTPSQHVSNRGLFDRYTTLWSSWMIEASPFHDSPTPEEASPHSESPPVDTKSGPKLWFAGDTGYRSVRAGEDEETVPVCPAFAEIGKRFGGVDLALIPIGAYSPRPALSPVHAAPQDSVRIFKDVMARKAVAMHWGTWSLSFEEPMEPPARLKEECARAGIPEGEFEACAIGETVVA